MSSSVLVPLAIGLGVAVGVGWRLVAVPALLLIGTAAAASWGRAARPQGQSPAHGHLPRTYWLPWSVVALVVCIEFGVLFWAATMVERSTGVSLAEATLTISVFLAGAVLARTAVSFAPALARIEPMRMIRASLGLVVFGTLAVWASPSYEVSLAAMLVGGVGLGVLYPVTASVTLATATAQPGLASTRLVLATALALLVSPFVLGVAADLFGVVTAWLLIPAIGIATLLLTLPMTRARSEPDEISG
jgi:MFS family permease